MAAALGNNHALWLLEPELRKWKYSANLMASRGFVDQLAPSFWKGNVYHRWLDTLRTLDDLPEKGFLPEVMQGSVWRDKQLQTQLASWSELRHDNVLYTKQSYTGVPMCEYPDGFVEPYPAIYRKLGEMASTTADRIEALEMQHEIANQRESYQRTKQQQVRFLARFAGVMNQLEAISIQELAGEPMTDAQRLFIETTIDRRGTLPYGSGGKPHYDGWYCELLYDEKDPSLWDPIIADVHTNPRDHKAIQVGVGDVNFAVLAVDNESDVAAYVGPVYSFYEFNQPAEERMTDKQWQLQISTGQVPPRPDWTNSFAASPTKRDYGGFFVRSEGDYWVVSDSLSASQLQGPPNSDDHVAVVFRGSPPDSRLEVKASDEGLQELLSKLDEHGSPARFGITLGSVTLKGLKSLVDVKSLAWIDATGSEIAEVDIENFRRLRPDVDVLRRELELETIAVCREIKGLQQFEEDTSGKLKPGQPLLLYLEPKNLTRSSRRFDMVMELKVTLWLVNEPNSLVAHQITEPLELQNFQPGDLKYATLSLVIPESLKRGTYKLVVEIEDVAARPSCIASEEIVLEY
ncbi:hypothetical protein Pla144_08220 [Bythopirellula polymerisocia]|uniref:Uncharacterized protein n=1 Tax=Bythopirellula polymerisocia TaxID=2528003 RepID=A0A5C6D458_9BACT|nr:hypothetical protein Pla144_08220 [Bythopirellula polymerisocia]